PDKGNRGSHLRGNDPVKGRKTLHYKRETFQASFPKNTGPARARGLAPIMHPPFLRVNRPLRMVLNLLADCAYIVGKAEGLSGGDNEELFVVQLCRAARRRIAARPCRGAAASTGAVQRFPVVSLRGAGHG